MEKVLQNLIENTPDLLNFFAGYFPLAEFDGLTDEQVVTNYMVSNTKETIVQTKKELDALQKDSDVLEIIAREANKYFESCDDTWQWIQKIKEMYTNALEYH